MLNKIIFFFFAALSTLSAASEEIRIYLPTESPLHPLYLGQLQASGTSFSNTYLQELEGVLLFDLNHNGSTKVTSRLAPKEELLRQKNKAQCFQAKIWKEAGIAHVVKGEIVGNLFKHFYFYDDHRIAQIV